MSEDKDRSTLIEGEENRNPLAQPCPVFFRTGEYVLLASQGGLCDVGWNVLFTARGTRKT